MTDATDEPVPPEESSADDVYDEEDATEDTAQDSDTGPPFDESRPMPIVGLGASAGGLNALRQFFSALPDDNGMAFVVVLHLAPDYESNLASILSQDTGMSVVNAEEGMEVTANHVYVIPAGRHLEIRDGTLHVMKIAGRHNVSTIDRFFRTLAEDQNGNAAAVILSGTGTDGTVGIREIKEQAGVTMAQLPEEAEYDSMPQSAITTGLIDLSLPVRELAEKLVEYRSSAGKIQLPEQPESLDEDGKSLLQKVFTRLYTTTGHDFSNYKRSMVLRRLERRLQIRSLRSLEEYLQYLREDETEVRALYKDLLISVTSFFRDPEAFEAVQEKVIPELFADKTVGDQVRVWVPGCATGEEAYSLAMQLVEYADQMDHAPEVQIFATDVDEEALQVGRDALYPEPIKADVSRSRLERFFDPEGNYYRVSRRLREVILFAKHNLLTDPPFSNLDFVSCRNLLIYLEQEIQEHVFNILHYGLNEGGYLFLGRSEAGSRASRLFSTVDKANNILQARVLPDSRRERLPFSKTLGAEIDVSKFFPSGGAHSDHDTEPEVEGLEDLHHELLAKEVASVLVDENHEIIHLTDRASKYLTFKGGAPTHELLSCVPEALRPDLRSSLYQVFKKGKGVERTGIKVTVEGETHLMNVSVHPVERGAQTLAQVRFHEMAEPEESETPSADDDTDRETEIRAELERTREQLQTTSEEYEAATEEMEAANEELLSMNEELQSKNEELETSKEELQSVNEELKTTNQELKTKIEEVRETNSDLQNLMAATQIATLFLDRDLRITRFTPQATELFNIQPTDKGRALGDFTQRFEYEDLIDDARTALRELDVIEREIHQSDDKWFLLRLRPYRTVQDKIEGVVLTFVDITQRREAERAQRRSEELYRLAVDAGEIGTWDVDLETGDCRISPVMARHMGYESDAPDDLDGPWQQIVPREKWMGSVHPEDRELLEDAIAAAEEDGEPFDLEFRIEADDSIRWLYSKGEVVHGADDESKRLRGATTNITEQKRVQQDLRRERNFIQSVLDTIGALVVVLDADGQIVRFNRQCENASGYSEEEVQGEDLVELLVPPAEEDRVREVLFDLVDGTERSQIENHWQTRDGERRRIQWSNTVLRDEAGSIQYVIGTGIDITERRQLEQEVVNAGERVRQEIGQDLHDILSSDLAALAMKSDNLRRSLDDDAAKDALEGISEGLRSSADRSRTLSHALIPVALQEEHLAAALENLCREQDDITDIDVFFDGDRDERLPARKEVAMHLHRIAHEAVTNARRHADPSEVRVSLRREDGHLVMTVRDDGTGIPEDTDSTSGIGLRTMGYRADLINASLKIEPVGEGGTIVQCRLPLGVAEASEEDDERE